ncbi:hypothetical protein [Oceaniovalibus sp. ACAM 378]|uniref:hypothetical protein n=1 Tax=Oceaniovalibus sp. ACAM 378 TaxID=2599923 RepID=UPI0011DA7D0D|nr:hypothetical protein [Oceaniovalibus sp. ACAM 378]TYB84398.1 hypothetical protein FQ320_21905 [Oceaniovalibus sp. ACAM 378]
MGAKQHIGACVPDALWLAENSPTPPLLKILKDYLPKIHDGNESFYNWSRIRPLLNKTITSFTEDRNRLAHRGEKIAGTLDDYLRLTENLMYAFDVFEGHDWAKDHVSKEFADKLGWEQTSGHRLGSFTWLRCTNPMKDSSREASVVAGMDEQTFAPDLQDQKLAGLQ